MFIIAKITIVVCQILDMVTHLLLLKFKYIRYIVDKIPPNSPCREERIPKNVPAYLRSAMTFPYSVEET